MTPEQIDAAANALINLGAAVDTYGPGIAVTVGAGGVAWAGRRIRGHIARRRQERRDRANAWWMQCFNPPAIDTETGHDTDALITCHQIFDATDTARKEKP